ncbi:MAG: hypothetical protein HY738_15105 [Bacteroidia bacterium]|nr:hypothetical protein [Bacteroidia bacterium]
MFYVGICVFLITVVNAQKIVLKSGDLSKIKGEKFFNIKYDYSGMTVGKYKTEEEYVNDKVQNYNKSDAGRGDKWKESWVSDRESRFQVKFEELLNKYTEGAKVFVGTENKDAKYTMVLHTTFTEPGFNVYVTKKPAMIHAELLIVETANPDNVIATIITKNNPGTSMGNNDYDTGERIQEAYAKCGKELGKWLIKQVWKK